MCQDLTKKHVCLIHVVTVGVNVSLHRLDSRLFFTLRIRLDQWDNMVRLGMIFLHTITFQYGLFHICCEYSLVI